MHGPGDRVLRRPLHGGDREDPVAGVHRAASEPALRVSDGGHGGPGRGRRVPEGAPRGADRGVCEHDRRDQDRGRPLLYQRQRGKAHLHDPCGTGDSVFAGRQPRQQYRVQAEPEDRPVAGLLPASLFLNPEMTTADKLALTEKQILEDSGVLFYYGSAGTRVDSFFYALEHPATIYKFPNNNKGEVKGGFVRFWDMFLSWASQLELVERLNMKRQGYTLSNDKFFSAAYFINPVCNVDVQAVLDRAFYRQLLIDISDLVMEICLAFRCSISTAQQAIIDYYQSQPDRVSLIRTSEIFIKETELNKNDRILYPKYKGSFVSHIKLRKNG